MNFIFDFLIGFLVGRTARNTALAAERASWTEEIKVAHWNALAEREAAQRALREQQWPLLYILIGFLAVLMVLGALFGG